MTAVRISTLPARVLQDRSYPDILQEALPFWHPTFRHSSYLSYLRQRHNDLYLGARFKFLSRRERRDRLTFQRNNRLLSRFLVVKGNFGMRGAFIFYHQISVAAEQREDFFMILLDSCMKLSVLCRARANRRNRYADGAQRSLCWDLPHLYGLLTGYARQRLYDELRSQHFARRGFYAQAEVRNHSQSNK